MPNLSLSPHSRPAYKSSGRPHPSAAGAATFTGKGDKEKVVVLYKEYAAKVFGEFNRAQHGATAEGLRVRSLWMVLLNKTRW